MAHVFGPVPSRRLGRSLGIDPVPFKTCNYNCVYCQLGRTTRQAGERTDFGPPEPILAELREALRAHGDRIDYLTITGSGEPTLHAGLGTLIRGIRRVSSLPVAVLTNGGLLSDPEVRRDLASADVVLPSLDAADADTFRAVNRPRSGIRIEEIVEGLVALRREHEGELWTETMLVGEVNDSEEQLLAIREALARARPHRVYVNVPIRPPAESDVRPPDAGGLIRAQVILGGAIFLARPEPDEWEAFGTGDPVADLLGIIGRHPVRRESILRGTRRHSPQTVDAALAALIDSGRVRPVTYRGREFLTVAEGRYGSPPAG
jgi:wyosine [tRNA(Phe)-imidazoG37] synthetase (radical SAM superfamily)